MDQDSKRRQFRKEKVGFWCPPDVDEGVQKLLDEGKYQDRSKAFVDLVRKGLKNRAPLPPKAQKTLEALARVLERDPDVIIGQCVEGIISLIESDGQEMPMIFEEIKLRRTRHANREKAAASEPPI